MIFLVKHCRGCVFLKKGVCDLGCKSSVACANKQEPKEFRW